MAKTVRFTAIFIKQEQWLVWLLQATTPACAESTAGFFTQNHFYCSITTELIRHKQIQNSSCQLHKQIFTPGHKTSPKAALLPGINSFTAASWRKPLYHLAVKNICSKPNHRVTNLELPRGRSQPAASWHCFCPGTHSLDRNIFLKSPKQ